MTLITDSWVKNSHFFIIFGIFLFLQRAIHLIYKKSRWYHFLYNPSTWCLDPDLSEFIFELTNDINLYTYHGWMRRVVKFYPVIDVVAVFMSLVAIMTSGYIWFIVLVAYLILHLLYVGFYWPHVLCRCTCYRTLKWFYCLLAVVTFWFYMGCPLWPLLASMGTGPSASLIGVFLFLFYFIVFYIREWTRGNLPPFKHVWHPVYSVRVTRHEILAVPLIQRPEGY